MPKFVTRIVEEIKAKQVVEQLFKDDIGQLHKFENQLVGTSFQGEYHSLLAFIEHFANGGNPGNKVKYLKGNRSDGTTEFEFRSKHLRIYAIQLSGKKIIVYGGRKRAADSSDNIAAFRAIKKEYLDFLKSQKNETGKPYKK